MIQASISGAKPPTMSFELFPPKSDAQFATLQTTVDRLAAFRPEFFSVTYGAGGSTQDRSRSAVRHILDRRLPVAAHLTCAGASRDAVKETIAWFRRAGVAHFLALRGDPPGGLSERYAPHPDGFTDTADLVEALQQAGAAQVTVSAYPERHPQSPDWRTEIDVLKRKVDAGAVRAITQFFFDNDVFEAYVERVRSAGISIPIVPGIIPIHRFPSIRDFASRCGAAIPTDLARRFDGLDPASATHGLVAAAVAAEQVSDLMARGVDAFHIYTLNRSELPEAVCRIVGVAAETEKTACAA